LILSLHPQVDEITNMNVVPTIDAFDHIHVYVADLSAAEAWYERVLGFVRTKELEFWAAGGGPLTIQNESGSVHIALFERGRPKECHSTLALRVSGVQYLRWRVHLQSALPGEFSEEDHEASVSLYFSDPDANPYEITSYEVSVVKGA
jgi:catechol-2,3-dioxygenase